MNGLASYRGSLWRPAVAAACLAYGVVYALGFTGTGLSSARGSVFCVSFVGFCVNAVALRRFLRILGGVLPFTQGDRAEAAPAGIVLGFTALLMQLALLSLLLICLLVP